MDTEHPISIFNRTRRGTGKSHFLGKVDKRSMRARRWRELHNQFLNQLNDDLSELSETQRHLLNSVVDLALRIEIIRDELVRGRDVDPLTINRLSRTFVKLCTKLGLEQEDE